MVLKKLFLTAVAACCMGSASAQISNNENLLNENDTFVSSFNAQDLQPLSPTYLEGVYLDAGWRGNWFLSVKGGVNAFIGKPVNCGDLTDRLKPLLNISLGKWFTPYVGGRISFQGLEMKNNTHQSVSFQNVHADFLYNVSNHLRKDAGYLPHWDCIPYLGVGIIHNAGNNQKPFAFSYGLTGRYRLANRVHLIGEIGGTTTFRDFDGVGEGTKIGDNLFHASIGLSVTVGKNGWKRVVDAKPYIYQNDQLAHNINILREQNKKLSKALNYSEIAITEMQKVLEIEGLLGKYNLLSNSEVDNRLYPKNNYSGLNSLRERLRNRNWNGDMNNYKPMLADAKDNTSLDDSVSVDIETYINDIRDGKTYIGAPILFFFKIKSNQLTDNSQIINIKKIADVMKKYNLRAKIVGAADSATGSDSINDKLSAKRANCIAHQLKKFGISEEKIDTRHRGGINAYKPVQANRHTCVLLYVN